MQFLPFGYNRDEEEAWAEPIRIGKIFATFVVIVTVLWGLGAIVLAIKDPIPRWGMVEDD